MVCSKAVIRSYTEHTREFFPNNAAPKLKSSTNRIDGKMVSGGSTEYEGPNGVGRLKKVKVTGSNGTATVKGMVGENFETVMQPAPVPEVQ